MRVFLVDFGSTFVKWAVYDMSSHEWICTAKQPFPKPCVNDGIRFEISESAIRALVHSVFAEVKQCKRAYISVQMHGYLLRDNSGKIGNYVSWRDKTGSLDISADLSSRGTSLKANSPIAKLFRDDHGGATFFTLGSYITYLLTGRNITHKTDACASGYFDAGSLTAEDTYGLILPEVTDRVSVAGRWNGMDIYTPMGDHQVSYLGSGAGEGEYLINIGTATQISCWERSRFLQPGTECRPHLSSGWLPTVTGLTGGAELFAGSCAENLCNELLSAIKKLPQRKAAVVGGGGGAAAFERIKAALAEHHITCRQAHTNIGMEGLLAMAEADYIKTGTMLSEVAFTNFPIILKNAGLDFFIIDCEHGAFEYHVLSELITKSKLLGLHAIVRIGDNRRESITKLADMGASGFLLPMTGTAEDIRTVVECAKYSPLGKRGISTTRAHTLYNPPKLQEYMQQANSQIKIYAQIETAQGVENVLQILETPGVDGLFIGPNDLSDDLGCIGELAPVIACMEKVAAASRQTGKPWGIITANQRLLDAAQAQNVNMISCGSELNMLVDGCKRLRARFE